MHRVPRFETSTHEAYKTVFFNHMLNGVPIGDSLRKSLPRGFDHPKGVGDRVWDHGGEETDQGVATQLFQRILSLENNE